MTIGCVTEIKKQEFRVGITPENVKEYTQNGHTVLIQRGAGIGSSFPDSDYQKMGAMVLDTAAEVWAKSDMIIKVKEPLPEEYEFFKEGQIIFTFLHLAAAHSLAKELLAKKVKAVSYETIRNAHGGLPLLRPMSEVAGRLSVQEGTRCLEKTMGGMGVLLGGVPGAKKANVMILGGGVVGTNALKIALGMGADVTVLDNNMDRLVYLDDIYGQSIQTIYSTAGNIERAISEADLAIGAVLIPGAAAPKLIKKNYLKNMKKGSVIVDVAIDQGGCCETSVATSHDNPTFVVDDIIHYCVANIPGVVSRTATTALTNATLSYGLDIANKGLEKAALENKGLLDGINCYNGELTIKEVATQFDINYSDPTTLILS